MRRLTAGSLVVLGVAVAAALLAAPSEDIAYPEDYRNWTHVKSMVIHDPSHPLHEAFGGIHHVYVNQAGAARVRGGSGAYPEGSIFVFDLLEANLGGGAYVEGHRKVLAVMVKDSRRFASTGGWGFQGWAGGDRSKPVVKDAATECFQCHTPQKANDYVFSTWRP